MLVLNSSDYRLKFNRCNCFCTIEITIGSHLIVGFDKTDRRLISCEIAVFVPINFHMPCVCKGLNALLFRQTKLAIDYYNGVRTHLSLGKDSPDQRPVRKEPGFWVNMKVGKLVSGRLFNTSTQVRSKTSRSIGG